MKFFTVESTRQLAESVAEEAAVGVCAHEEREFEDAEFKIRSLESVRDEQVFVCQSLFSDRQHSVNDKLCRLSFFIGSLRDAGASEVIALVPYLGFARKDRRTKSRDPVTTRYVAEMFEAVGLSEMITADVHNLAAFENAFRCKKENIEAAPLFVEHFANVVGSDERIVVLSPDAGGVKRAKAFASGLATGIGREVGLAFVEKHRSEGRVTGELFAGDVQAAVVIVIDDLISSGTTMLRAARACLERGAETVHAAATHGVFGKGAASVLGAPELASVAVTNTVGAVKEHCAGLGSRLVILDCAPLFADAVRRRAGDAGAGRGRPR